MARDRSYRSLEFLKKSAATSRVLNLWQISLKEGGKQEYEASPFFKNSLLNKAIVVKHRVRGGEADLFDYPVQNATKILLPIAERELRYGARFVFVGQKNFEDVIAVSFGDDLQVGTRDRNILDMATATGGEVTSTEGAACVAKIVKSIEGSTNGEWASDTINFVYSDKNASVEKLNVIFSATDYFGDRNNIVDGNSLTIDNVEFVYYHALTALSTTDSEGNALPGCIQGPGGPLAHDGPAGSRGRPRGRRGPRPRFPPGPAPA